MKLLTKEIEAKLRRNSRERPKDPKPVVKLFTPDAGATWLLTELDDDDVAFGLCDMGMGYPELGYVSLEEIKEIRGRFHLPVERDRWFRPNRTLSAYADAAREHQRIVA